MYIQFAFALCIARELVSQGRDTSEFRERLLDQGKRMERMGRAEYFDQIDPCAFLQDKKCSIYALRPIDCRSYYVVTPPEDCRPPTHDKLIGSLAMFDVRASSMKIGKEAHQLLGLRETGMRILMGPLPSTVLLGLEVLQDDVGDWRDHVRRQKWLTAESLMNLKGDGYDETMSILRKHQDQSGLYQLSKKK